MYPDQLFFYFLMTYTKPQRLTLRSNLVTVSQSPLCFKLISPVHWKHRPAVVLLCMLQAQAQDALREGGVQRQREEETAAFFLEGGGSGLVVGKPLLAHSSTSFFSELPDLLPSKFRAPSIALV
jgi:hypothetical protein